MSEAPVFVPSIDDYVKAFRKIDSDMRDNHRKMLAAHYNSPCHVSTARKLGQAAGGDFQKANLQYGHLGTRIAEAMGVNFTGMEMLALTIPSGDVANSEPLWVLRTNVASALEELGWVEKTSHLF